MLITLGEGTPKRQATEGSEVGLPQGGCHAVALRKLEDTGRTLKTLIGPEREAYGIDIAVVDGQKNQDAPAMSAQDAYTWMIGK